jgi:hypothetical protein
LASLEVVGDQQLKLIHYWRKHPANYIFGTDDTNGGKPLIWTKDEKDSRRPIKPFPTDKDFLRIYVDLLWRQHKVLVDKSRQMVISTTTLRFMDWHCRFRDARRWLLSKATEDEAKELIEDKIRFGNRMLPEWLQKALPATEKPQRKVYYGFTSSYILGCNEAVAERQARGGTASGVFIDEAARQVFLKRLIAGASPMCDRIVAVTTADFGTPGADEFLRLRDEGKTPTEGVDNEPVV